jgi:hypothetical protein
MQGFLIHDLVIIQYLSQLFPFAQQDSIVTKFSSESQAVPKYLESIK